MPLNASVCARVRLWLAVFVSRIHVPNVINDVSLFALFVSPLFSVCFY